MEAPKTWSRLDNAAKFFPPTSTGRNPHVFRLACELHEPADPQCLQAALDDTLRRFPYFRSSLKRGFFWYYFEELEGDIQVKPETLPPCSAIYHGDSSKPLFRLIYFKNRISFEIYHALSDGLGAFTFFRSLVQHYLVIKYGIPLPMEEDASLALRQRDDFEANYSPKNRRRGVHGQQAYRAKGERLPGHLLNCIVGRLPLDATLEKARGYGATLSEYLTALLIGAIGQTMNRRERTKKPVAVSVPVDLRRFYASHTVRNFFANFGAVHSFANGKSFEDILSSVKKCYTQRLDPDALDQQVNQFAALEHNPAARVVPLFLKTLILAISGAVTEGGDSAGFSNLGRVDMPKAAAGYIKVFDVLLSTNRPQICASSFVNVLSIGFTSPLVGTEVQCAFFRALSSHGIHAQIYSNHPLPTGGGL